MDLELSTLLRIALERGASDLHLAVPNPPVLRIKGGLHPLQEFPRLTPESTATLFNAIASDANREVFYGSKELDFPYSIPGLARFRVNASLQRGTIALSFRSVPHQVPVLGDLGLPELCIDLAARPRGLVLVAGPTGSGKSTTLAAMVNHINQHFSRRIITIEDPIEYLHTNQQSMLLQRELGSDTLSFASGLRAALRQDPDVIMLGEMRDPETITTALTAAETGHLVLSTLHTNGAAQAVERILDVYQGVQQEHVRAQLAAVLEGVIFQLLLPKADGSGRVVAVEALVGTPAVRNLIRTGELHQLYSFMQIGTKDKMQTLDSALANLVNRGLVRLEDAKAHSANLSELQRSLDARLNPRRS
ncbi:MAG: type IV pilus twitching motility protein PilT [Chloroflexi bacterium]|nr:type IV pilus twitching motility protein PilT [Chloroflexota bacterium]